MGHHSVAFTSTATAYLMPEDDAVAARSVAALVDGVTL
jgi:hypothetical protein